MSSTQYRCKNEQRRAVVRKGVDGRFPVNGIDYLEVASDQKTLVVYFIHNLPGAEQENPVPPRSASLNEENVAIAGGSRIQDVRVESASCFGNILLLRVNHVGDLSTYTLRLVHSPSNSAPPVGFDPQLSLVSFSFWVEEFSEFDCQKPDAPPEKLPPPPAIDYLAKDYASFRRLMLDRLAVTMPQWRERNPADVGVMLVELMAYAADYLSYYQDAVATEAYLGTARRRVSIRRHARLLDYLMHDGCNARAWVVINVSEPLKLLGPSQRDRRPGTPLLTKTSNAAPVVPAKKVDAALDAGGQVFETLHDIGLHPDCNEIHFYTWDEEQCYLPKGATQATLADTQDAQLHKLLTPGKVLMFEEVLHPTTGNTVDVDPSHRHVVRLTKVTKAADPLHNRPIVEVAWAPDDAVPFDLCISSLDEQGRGIANVSVARGNVVLVDSGRTVVLEDLSQNPGWERLRPRLEYSPLTQQGYVINREDRWVIFDGNASARAAMGWEMRDARPAIAVWEVENPNLRWQVQRDLLNSDRFAPDFVVETEDDGRAYLRFGDDRLGKRPRTRLSASYRIGNGNKGNVGAEAIAHLIAEGNLAAILSVRNPLPAQGGTEPETIEQVRLDAPQAFRVQRRAVTEADYAAAAQRYPQVQRAVATRRWTGSWYTIFITVDREGGRSLDEEFVAGLTEFLEGFRLAGHDIAIDAPRYVPLDIAIAAQVAPDYFRGAVKQALLETFSSTVLPNGQLGFFHPDRFTFGQSVYLSQVIATAVKVAGVQSAKVTRFQRWGQPTRRELETGQIFLERLEILQLENNSNAPENGRVVFNLEGGL